MATIAPVKVDIQASTSRSGARTSEFWFFLLSFVVSLCVSRGWIPASEESRAREVAQHFADFADMALIVLPMAYGFIRSLTKHNDSKVAAGVVAALPMNSPRQVVLNLPGGPVVAVFDPSTNTVTRVEAPAPKPAPASPAA